MNEQFVEHCARNESKIVETMLKTGSISNIDIGHGFSVSSHNGHIRVVKLLFPIIKENNDVNSLERAFTSACASGQLKILKFLEEISYYKKLSKKQIHDGFMNAIKHNRVKIVSYLLTHKKTKPSIRYNSNEALKEACNKGYIKIVKFLLTSKKLKKYSSIDYKNMRPLIEACKNDQIEVVKFLLSSKKIKEKNNIEQKSNKILKNIIKPYQLNVLQYLLKNYNFNSFNKITLINNIMYECVQQNNIDFLKYLLESKKFKNKTFKNKTINTLFYEACRRDYLEIIKYLGNMPILLTEGMDQGFRAAFINDNLDILDFIITKSPISNIEQIKQYFRFGKEDTKNKVIAMIEKKSVSTLLQLSSNNKSTTSKI